MTDYKEIKKHRLLASICSTDLYLFSIYYIERTKRRFLKRDDHETDNQLREADQPTTERPGQATDPGEDDTLRRDE